MKNLLLVAIAKKADRANIKGGIKIKDFHSSMSEKNSESIITTARELKARIESFL